MRQTLLALLCGLVCLSTGSSIFGDESEQGTHELTGPVQVLWAARYDGSDSQGGAAYSMTVSPDGSTVFVTGETADRWGREYATVAYDANTGEETWASRNEVYGHARAVSVSPNGSTVFVTGYSAGPGTNYDYATVAYLAETGDEIWVSRYNGPGSASDVAWSMAVSPDGSTVFVTGGVLEYAGDYATVAYDADTGDEIWVARYDGPGSADDLAFSMDVGPDGSTVFVTGTSGSLGTHYDYATVAYDANTGEENWVVRYDGPSSRYDGPASMAVNPDGSTVFVTGLSSGLGAYPYFDYATVAYDANTGEESWVARYDGPASGYDSPESIAVNPDGSTVFVTGWCAVGAPYGPYDYTTIAYSLILPIEIDIKPGGFPNSVNPRNRGVIPVAILGSDEFDLADVDVSALRFGPDEAAPRHNGHHEEVNFDGIMDLVAHFSTQETGIVCGMESAALSGSTTEGRRFEGTDSIRTVGCPRSEPRPVWTPQRVRRDKQGTLFDTLERD